MASLTSRVPATGTQFYTGLVAEMYDACVSYVAPVGLYAALIREAGDPALELACGTGHPLLDLVARGLNVHGLDSSRDMLARCRAKARARGLRVRLYRQEMQRFTLPTRYRTIYLAGASFMLLAGAGDAERALRRIRRHLEPGGRVVVPLYIPPRSPEAAGATDQWRARETVRPEDGATLRVSGRFHYDGPRQRRVATLRYEVIRDGTVVQAVERPWVLRWYSREELGHLLHETGFHCDGVIDTDRRPAAEDAVSFVFLASRPAR